MNREKKITQQKRKKKNKISTCTDSPDCEKKKKSSISLKLKDSSFWLMVILKALPSVHEHLLLTALLCKQKHLGNHFLCFIYLNHFLPHLQKADENIRVAQE